MSCKCNCASGLANLGYANCDLLYGITTKLILLPLVGSTGAKNFYDPAVTLDQAYLDGKINAVNPADRWYPTPLIENVLDETGDATYDTAESGTAYFIKDGVRKVTGYFFEVSQKFACKLSENTCVKFGVFMVDNCGNVLGVDKGDGKLYPIPVQAFTSKFMPKTNTSVAKAMFSFEFLQTVTPCSLEGVASEYIDADVLGANGLLSAQLNVISSTAGILNVKITSEYGSFGNKAGVKGLVLSDLVSLLNVTQGTTLTASALTESLSEDGVYTITYNGAGVAVTDKIKATFTAVIDGFDYSQPNSVLITVA